MRPFADEVFEEVEDAGVFPLVFAEGFVVHEEVYEGAVDGGILEPFDVGVGLEWPFFPAAVTEAEGDVVAEAVVFQEEFDVFRAGWAVDVVRAAPLQDRVPALCDDAFETVFVCPMREVVIIAKFGVAEDFWRDAESVFNLLHMHVDLALKLVATIEEGQGMVVRLCNNFCAPRGD